MPAALRRLSALPSNHFLGRGSDGHPGTTAQTRFRSHGRGQTVPGGHPTLRPGTGAHPPGSEPARTVPTDHPDPPTDPWTYTNSPHGPSRPTNPPQSVHEQPPRTIQTHQPASGGHPPGSVDIRRWLGYRRSDDRRNDRRHLVQPNGIVLLPVGHQMPFEHELLLSGRKHLAAVPVPRLGPLHH